MHRRCVAVANDDPNKLVMLSDDYVVHEYNTVTGDLASIGSVFCGRSMDNGGLACGVVREAGEDRFYILGDRDTSGQPT